MSINNWYSSNQAPKQEIQPIKTISPETNETQTRREEIRNKLLAMKTKINSIQLQIDRADNQESRLNLVTKFDDLKAKYRKYFTGLSFEDREYFKNRLYLIN
jgi:predicted nuclease with TOPRIM domain